MRQYRKRIEALDYPRELIKLYLGEGDSEDNTWNELNAWFSDDPTRLVLVKRDTGRPRMWHTPKAERMLTLSITGNAIWNRLVSDGFGDYGLMLESDLLITPDIIGRLIERMPQDAAALAPMVWIPVDDTFRFYDVWAFRTLAQNPDQEARMFPPYGPAWYAKELGDEPAQIASVGSIVLFRMDVLQAGARLCPKEAVLGMCKQIRGVGGKIYADPASHVIHPIVEGAK